MNKVTVTISEDAISALTMAIVERERRINELQKGITSDKWRKTYEAELTALEETKNALLAAEITI